MSEFPAAPDSQRRAWFTYVRQELTTSAQALAEAARGFAAKCAGSDFAAASAQLVDRADVYRTQVAQFLETSFESAPPPARKILRHDLRGAVGYIVSALDDIEESTTAERLSELRPELPATLSVAHKILQQLGSLLKESTDGSPHPVEDSLARLPAAIASAVASADLAAPGRILIVDDNEFSRDLMAKQLRQQGHAVETVAGAREAQARLSDSGAPPVDVVVSDVLMPGITGLDLLKWLKADPLFWPIPVIMVSALGDEDGVLACIGAGAEDYLTRPVRADLLRARIAGGLEKKRLRDREVENRARIDRLVRAIFPPAVVDEWRQHETIRPKRHEKVGVLFTDIVGFTTWCENYRDRPELVVDTLQALIRQFEDVARRFGVQKIKTIGDAFMAVAGLTERDPNPALTLLQCAGALIDATKSHPAGWAIRVGIHVGPVVTGILGQTQFSFDVWGQTVNAAARMESNGLAGRVTLSAEAWVDVEGVAEGTLREAEVKGLGAIALWDFDHFRPA